MNQDDLWNKKWLEYMTFLKKYERRPSKHKVNDMPLYNWYKHSRKLRNQGKLRESRKAKFEELIALAVRYQRVNQHGYIKE